MRTLRQALKQSLTLFLFIGTFLNLSPVFAETAGAEDTGATHANANAEWPGVYLGFTPCADCNGIKTELGLNKNNTYLLLYQYKGKSDREYVEKGKFTWGSQSNTIVLTPNKGGETRHYQIGENILTQLDRHGIAYTGKDAARYVLRRTEVLRKKVPHH